MMLIRLQYELISLVSSSLVPIIILPRPLDASLAVYEADSATILFVFPKCEADYAIILPHFLQYEADSAANLPLILLYE